MKTLTVSLLSALCLATPALAVQPSQADSIHHLDSVAVLGRLPQEVGVSPLSVPLRKTPMTVSNLDGKMLKERAITDIKSALSFVPAVTTRTTFGAFQEIAVRGFYKTIYMQDGIRDERSTINSYPIGDLYNVERIEVLKGPASVLYGYAATGGVVNVVRRVPTDTLTLGAHARYGSLGYYDLGAHVGGKIADGLNFYAGGFLSGGKQWRSLNDKRRSLFGALSYTSGVHSLVLRAEGRNDYYGTDTGLAPTLSGDTYRVSDDKLFAKKGALRPGLDRSWRYNDASDFMYNRGYNTSLKYTLSLPSGWKLSDYISYAYDDIDYFSTEGLRYPTSDEPGAKYGYYRKTEEGKKVYYDLDHVIHDQNLRFSHLARTLQNTLEFTGGFSWGAIKHNVRGAYSTTAMRRVSYTGYNEDDIWGAGRVKDTETGEITFPEVDVINPSFNGHLQAKFSGANLMRVAIHGFSLSDVLEFSPQLKAMAALRYDLYKYSGARTVAKDGKRQYDEPKRGDFTTTSPSALSYRVGLVYLPTTALSFYTSLGSFFVPDNTTTFNPKNQLYYDKKGNAITAPKGGSYFEPQKGYQLEVGTKYTLNDRLQLNLSAYYIRRENEVMDTSRKIEVNGKPVDFDIYAQVGATKGTGFEADVTYRPLSGLELSAGYSYTSIKVAEANATEVTKLFNIGVGTTLNWVPKHEFFSYGSYAIQRGVLEGLSFNYSLSYRDRVYYDVSSDLSFDPYTQLDLGAAYALPAGFSLALQVRNVLGAKNYTSELNGTQLFPNEPANALVTLSYKL